MIEYVQRHLHIYIISVYVVKFPVLTTKC